MKCPLQVIVGMTRGDTLNPAVMDCLKEECAWWDYINVTCSVTQLSVGMRHLVAVLDKIMVKMPHAGQFKK